jgi:outer membrane protein assembly factor BamA
MCTHLNSIRFFLLLFIGCIWINIGFAQTQIEEDSTCAPQKDLPQLISEKFNKTPKEKENSSSLLLVPIIGSNPATGFMFGVGGQYAFQMKGSSQYSALSGSIQGTTKSQMLILLKNNIYTKNDKFFYTGDWRFQIFSQDTYGLGTEAPDGGALDYQFNLGGLNSVQDSLAQPMAFNFFRFHQSVGYKIKQDVYFGLGYNFDGYYKIVDEKLRLEPGDSLLTSHYLYNSRYGFDLKSYHTSAIFANFMIDKRDNMISPYTGYFLSLGYRGAYRFTGNENNAELFQIEWRSYHSLSSKNPTHLLALWVMGNFSPEGGFPYMALPATAYDQRSRSSRGYTQGRFRGKDFVYSEAEYRFPISRCGGILGGVLFVNATSTNNQALELKLMESIQFAYGAGLRVMVDKKSRTNLTLDYGFGNKSSGFYLAVSETF